MKSYSLILIACFCFSNVGCFGSTGLPEVTAGNTEPLSVLDIKVFRLHTDPQRIQPLEQAIEALESDSVEQVSQPGYQKFSQELLNGAVVKRFQEPLPYYTNTDFQTYLHGRDSRVYLELTPERISKEQLHAHQDELLIMVDGRAISVTRSGTGQDKQWVSIEPNILDQAGITELFPKAR